MNLQIQHQASVSELKALYIFFTYCIVTQSLVILVTASLVSALCLVIIIVAVMVIITMSVFKRKKRNQQHEVESIDFNNTSNNYLYLLS